ncbi:putative transcription factor bHLH family [Helianthus anomalus]
MYPTSTGDHSNTINASGSNGGGGGIGLARYRSAPVSFLNTTVDSVINGENGQQNTAGNHMVNGNSNRTPTRFFSPPDTTSSQVSERPQTTSFRLNEFATAFNGMKSANQSPSPLFRHGSSPAGFLNTLVSSTPADVRGSRLSSQISFAGSSSFSQISEETNVTNPLVFSSSSSHNKRAKNDMNGLNIMESEFNFGLSESGLDAATMDLPHDSVPCKIRAKRGCATHPRSIAERERRTRISGKLKKLQDLVPNMDKQTSYSDMLDLAVQHIKGLQTHVQSLKKELQNCSCGCKPAN